MKKIFNYMLAATIAAFTFTSCEDVPEPYPIPGGGHGGGTELPEGTYVKESFSKDFGTFSVYTVEGTPWTIDFSTAKASGYDNTSQVTTPSKSYLVSPAIDLTNSTGAYIEFEYIYRYNRAGAENKTFITDNYTGDPTTTAWTDITGTLIEGTDWTTFEEFKANLPEQFIGKSAVVIAFYYACNSQNSATIEIKNLVVKEGSIEDVPEENPETPTPGEAKGKGTLEDPFNSIAANQLASSLADGAESDMVYIKGKISTIKEEFSTQYGNATFYISDDGTDNGTFYVFRTLYLGNQKYSGGENIKVGDEVIIYGKVCNYMGNTPETVQNGSYLYSLNGKTADGGSDTPTDGAKGDGTLENPYNSIAANSVASALKDGEQSDVVYIKGKVASIKEQYGTQYGNATFYISDDGTSNGQFYVFRALYLNNVKYTEGEVLHVGDDVVVCGKLCNYMGNTPETVTGEAYLYSLSCNGGTEEPENPDTTTPDEGSLLSNGTFEAWSNGLPVNWKTASTAGNATLSQSTDAHGGKYSVSVGYVTSANKRLGYKETELEAGKYKFTFWAKATKGGKSQTRAGYTPVVDGKVGTYVYGDYASLSTSWTEVTYEFELTEKTTICLVIMNPKNSSYSESQEILVDDAKLVKM